MLTFSSLIIKNNGNKTRILCYEKGVNTIKQIVKKNGERRSLSEFTDLVCDCGCDTFILLGNIQNIKLDGEGLLKIKSMQPMCFKCHKIYGEVI